MFIICVILYTLCFKTTYSLLFSNLQVFNTLLLTISFKCFLETAWKSCVWWQELHQTPSSYPIAICFLKEHLNCSLILVLIWIPVNRDFLLCTTFPWEPFSVLKSHLVKLFLYMSPWIDLLNFFSYSFWLFLCLLWRNVCSAPLPILNLGYLFYY